MAQEANFFVDVALVLFGFSLTFSLEFSYRELKIFPTLPFYQLLHRRRYWRRRRLDTKGIAALSSSLFNLGSLLVLGAFSRRLMWAIDGAPVDSGCFALSLVAAGLVGLLPWFIYWIVRQIVVDP